MQKQKKWPRRMCHSACNYARNVEGQRKRKSESMKWRRPVSRDEVYPQVAFFCLPSRWQDEEHNRQVPAH